MANSQIVKFQDCINKYQKIAIIIKTTIKFLKCKVIKNMLKKFNNNWRYLKNKIKCYKNKYSSYYLKWVKTKRKNRN